MITNLGQIPAWGWLMVIVLILISSGAIFYLLKRKFQVSKVEVTTGPVKTTLEPEKTEKTASSESPSNPNGITIRGNKLFGWNSLRIRRQGTQVEDNTLLGQNEIEVGAKPGPKSKKRKG